MFESILYIYITYTCSYIKWLYKFECYKYNLSTREMLQAAIDKQKREKKQGSPGEN